MDSARLAHLEALLDLRARIETFAARHAAQSAARGISTTPLQRAFSHVEKAVRNGDHPGMAVADEKLHTEIIRLADVPALHEAWRPSWEALRTFHDRSLQEHWPDLRALHQEHRYLVEAILSGDPGAAEDAAHHHLQAVRYRMAELRGAPPGGQDPVERVTAYLAFHLHRPLRLQTVARTVAFISPGHLTRLFRKRYGVGFQQYIQRQRLERAARLLRTSRWSIGRIAERVGYSDPSRFGQHFRRRFGTTPRAYRAESPAP